MASKININLGTGSLGNGCNNVIIDLYIKEKKQLRRHCELIAAPELQKAYQEWYNSYKFYYINCRSSEEEDDDEDPDEITSAGITNISIQEINDLNILSEILIKKFNNWLNIININFTQIIKEIGKILDFNDRLSVIIEVENKELEKLPWEWWDFVQQRYQCGISLGYLNNTNLRRTISLKEQTVIRLLGILGYDKNIDTEQEREAIERNKDINSRFIQQPLTTELDEDLRKNKWDIFFYSGHSKQGLLILNSSEFIDIQQLKYALNNAISQGLSLAIFNCCFGLDLARKIRHLNLPAMIVMKEEVPNGVAQRFLKYLLEEFPKQNYLDIALREAQKRLRQNQEEFPGAYVLTTLVHNSSEELPTWENLCTYQYEQVYVKQTVSLLNIFIRNLKIYLESLQKFLQNFNNIHSFLIPLSAIIISIILVIFIRYLGILQPAEFFFFDSFMRHKHLEGAEQNLLVIKVTESDKQKLEEDSLSDKTIITLIDKLKLYHPRVIGLDIYRDIPIPQTKENREQEKLSKQIAQNSSIITVCKVHENNNNSEFEVGEKISKKIPQQSLGFSDFKPDADGIIRRHLLQMQPPPNSLCQAEYALSFQLALSYLKKEGIVPQSTPKEDFLKLGKTIFTPLKFPASGYQNFEEGEDNGYQIMLDYKAYKEFDDIASSIFIDDVLTDKINLAIIKDKIILIGYDDVQADSHKTPYYQDLPGVYIHAQMISQIINAAEGKRSLLRWLPWWGDCLSISIFSSLGGLLIWSKSRSLIQGIIRTIIIVNFLALGISIFLIIGFFGLFQQGFWFPLIPSVVALWLTIFIGICFYTLLSIRFSER